MNIPQTITYVCVNKFQVRNVDMKKPSSAIGNVLTFKDQTFSFTLSEIFSSECNIKERKYTLLQ